MSSFSPGAVATIALWKSAPMVLRELIKNICQSNPDGYYTIMLDETSDISIQEQVLICFRFVSASTFDVQEVFVGFYSTDNTQSKTLLEIVKDVCIRFQLPINKCRS